MDKKIVIIIPTYEHPETLKKTLHSLVKQEYQNIEVRIVTEPECEQTIDFIDHLKTTKDWDERFSFVINDKKLGSLKTDNHELETIGSNDAILAGDDLIFKPDSIVSVMYLMEKEFPAHDAMVSFNIQSNKSWMVGSYALLGNFFIQQFPLNHVFCPDYNRIYCDYELREYAVMNSKHIFCMDALIRHHQVEDDTHNMNLWAEKQDKLIFKKRRELGLVPWGNTFNQLPEDVMTKIKIETMYA